MKHIVEKSDGNGITDLGSFSDCGGDGCEECDVCHYLGFLEWAGMVAPAGSTIERNEPLEAYLRAAYPGIVL